MKDIIGGLLYGGAMLCYLAGSLALFGVFCFGVYALFAESIALGFMYIGGAFVGGFVLQMACGVVMMAGQAIARAGE